jgi:hypothetical protein
MEITHGLAARIVALLLSYLFYVQNEKAELIQIERKENIKLVTYNSLEGLNQLFSLQENIGGQ